MTTKKQQRRLRLPRLISEEDATTSSPVSFAAAFACCNHPRTLRSSSLPLLASLGCCCVPDLRRSAADKRPVADASMRVRPAHAQRQLKEAKFCSVVPCGGVVDVEVKSSLLPYSAHRSQGRRRDVPIFPSRGRCPRHRGTRSSTDEDDSGCWSGDDATERPTRKPIPCAPLAVRGSFAVVKQSEDPRLDFLRSMAEMVVGNQIVSSKGLEQLLQCFLSLNSREHHASILAAFEDIWQVLFPAVPVRDCRRRSLQFAL